MSKISDIAATTASLAAGHLVELETSGGTSEKMAANNFGKGLAALAGGMQLIEEKTPTGVATVTFSSIPGTFRSLRLEWAARTAIVAINDSLNVTINGLGTAIYDRQLLSGAGGTATASEALAQTSAILANVAGSTAPAGTAGIGEAHIPAYADTSFQKMIVSKYAYCSGTASGNLLMRMIAINVRTTAAITSITIAAAANYESGSKLRLYGIS
jgi:hypothetical protein